MTYIGNVCEHGHRLRWTAWGTCAECETWEQAHDRVYPPVETVSTWSNPPPESWGYGS